MNAQNMDMAQDLNNERSAQANTAHIKTEAKPSCPVNHLTTLAIHGGAGVILPSNMNAKTEAAYRASLTQVLQTGAEMLNAGYSALDVVEAAIIMLEDDPKFNAGKGAVFTAQGVNELDAAIMDGRERNAGTVAGVTTVKNPIRLARAVMETSPHVMLQGPGAEAYARAQGLEMVNPDYFYTQRRFEQLQKKLEQQKTAYNPLVGEPETRFGTVGAVARDGCGNLAAGTSTGGLTAKKWGRVGDAPIIGAGTYADNRYCAVSATGTGEYFIRATVARDICARREFRGETIQAAADHLIHKTIANMGGDGGVIAIEPDGQFAFSFNTPGMYRGAIHNGALVVEIFNASPHKKAP